MKTGAMSDHERVALERLRTAIVELESVVGSDAPKPLALERFVRTLRALEKDVVSGNAVNYTPWMARVVADSWPFSLSAGEAVIEAEEAYASWSRNRRHSCE
ncbi:MAG: hypothetical protein AAF715_32140 [Myxococcota bacterium]